MQHLLDDTTLHAQNTLHLIPAHHVTGCIGEGVDRTTGVSARRTGFCVHEVVA